ncbi:hypothetical protein [Flavobacterium sp.]|uniref:hypothetical protein n=1 Tax=Flavobacterium sp. TaxID=239 RepID=UPI00263949AE|nr:hypothetical protein [Flavobacterium sp.]
MKVKVTENNDIKIERYTISTITSGHRFCDITNKRWSKTDRIYEADWGAGIDSLYIKNDSIIIMADIENAVIYDLAAKKFGYQIVLIDTHK